MSVALLREVSRYRCWTSAFSTWASTAPSTTTGTRASNPNRTSDPTAPCPYLVVNGILDTASRTVHLLTKGQEPTGRKGAGAPSLVPLTHATTAPAPVP